MRNNRLGCLSGTGILAAVVAALTIAGYAYARGGLMYNPGPLNAQSGEMLGGVTSHAETGGECEACHVAPWGSQTMADRCVVCHTSIAEDMRNVATMHGTLTHNDPTLGCWHCHPEHRGTEAGLTWMDDAAFPHEAVGFPLTGAHAEVACEKCHIDGQFQGLNAACATCHAEPDSHAGQFGTDCAACHSTVAWTPAEFNGQHTFPLDHGGRSTCATCHPTSFTTYTCYGCHEHKEARVRSEHLEEGISNFENCVECHPTGREHEGGEDHDD